MPKEVHGYMWDEDEDSVRRRVNNDAKILENAGHDIKAIAATRQAHNPTEWRYLIEYEEKA